MLGAFRLFAATLRHLFGGPTEHWDAYIAWLRDAGLGEWVPTDEERRSLEAVGFRARGAVVRNIPILAVLELDGLGRSPLAHASEPVSFSKERFERLALVLNEAHAKDGTVEDLIEDLQDELEGTAWPDGTGTVPYPVGARLEAALAAALVRNPEASELLLVGGDVSGIQRFLYTISSKGALKSLRARSLVVELLARSLAADVAEHGAGTLSQLYVGGGRFYCIVPNKSEVRDGIRKLADERAASLLQEFGGRLGFSLATIPFPVQRAWGEATDLWGRVQTQLNEGKRLQFRGLLLDPALWDPREVGEECEVCGQPEERLAPLEEPDPGEELVLACRSCRDLFRLGGQLARLQGFAEGAGVGVRIAGRQLQSLYDVSGDIPRGVRRTWVLPGYKLVPGANACRLPVATCIATGSDGQVLTVEQLADLSTGERLIGAVRMDADNLGRLFSEGLPPLMRTLAHVTALSRALEDVFSLRLSEILERGGRRITLVYGGGDDAFWLGPWDQVVQSVFDFHEAFVEATSGNPSVTLSAGVITADFRTPLHRLAAMAGEAEEAAKNAGRDCIALFRSGPPPLAVSPRKPNAAGRGGGEPPAVLPWSVAGRMRREVFHVLREGFTQVAASGKHLELTGGLSRALIHRLALLTAAFERTGQVPYAQLVWVLARLGERLRGDPERRRIWQTLAESLRRVEVFQWLSPFLTWLDLLAREGGRG
jgi:hypothetical protein